MIGGPDAMAGVRARVKALVSIAASNGSCLSTEHLSLLLPQGTFASLEALEDFLSRDEALRGDLTVIRGAVAPRGGEALIEKRTEQSLLAERWVAMATGFSSQLTVICPWVRLVGITGSIAYGGCNPEDDIDLFVVAEKGRLWITLSVCLFLAKLTRARQAASPVYCFNRMDDVGHCADIFGSPGDPLFAREALTLKVLKGEDYYRDLLQSSSWMEGYFPSLYQARLNGRPASQAREGSKGGPLWGVLDFMAFLAFGPYLWLVGLVRNRRLRRAGNHEKVFRTVVRPDFCAYESWSFDSLREEYRRTFS